MSELKNITGIEAAVAAIVGELDTRGAESLREIEPLASIVTTAENISERKADRATINKVRSEFDAERKAMEKEWKAAIGPVSDKYKAIVAKCDELVSEIDVGLKEYEEQRVLEKRQLIRQLWDQVEVPEGLAGWRDLEDIYNPKWENATYKEAKILEDMNDAMAALKMSYETLKAMNHSWEQVGLNALMETGDLRIALNRMNEMEEHARMVEERRKARELQEAERAAEEFARMNEAAAVEEEVEDLPEETAFPFIETPSEGLKLEPAEDFASNTTEALQMAQRQQFGGSNKIAVAVFVEPERLNELGDLLTFAGYDWRTM